MRVWVSKKAQYRKPGFRELKFSAVRMQDRAYPRSNISSLLAPSRAEPLSHRLVVWAHWYEGQLHEEDTMQFVLIIYHGTFPLPGTPESELISEEERTAVYATLNKMENMTPAPPLGLPENATTVRVENGSTVTTEGPYLGVKGAVGGFYVVEAGDLAAAVALAARVPKARLGGAVEVRPSAKYW